MSFRSLEKTYEAAEKSANKLADKFGPNAIRPGGCTWRSPHDGPITGRRCGSSPADTLRTPTPTRRCSGSSGIGSSSTPARSGPRPSAWRSIALIRDHLDAIAADIAAAGAVAKAFNMGSPMPGPHVDRLYRALYERSKSREGRGRGARAGPEPRPAPQGRGRAGRESRRPRDRSHSSVRARDLGPELYPPTPALRTPARPPRSRVDPRTGQGRPWRREIPQRQWC